MSDILLQTKLNLPQLRPPVVSRPRLLGRLDEGRSCKFTLISAGAGFGKTTLAASWVHHTREHYPHCMATWLSLDSGDNDPSRFLAYLVAALKPALPSGGATASTLLRSPSAPTVEPVLTLLLNELVAAEVELLCVIDDYHTIRTHIIHEAVTFLIDHLPPRMHLVLTSRSDPPFPLMRYRAHREMNEVRASELRFSTAEVSTYINEAMGLNLPEQDVGALEARTEGWIAGLQLAALSIQRHSNPQAMIASFTGSNRHIVGYLLEEVLEQQPPEIKSFLLHTSILDRLTGPLCDAVTGGSDSQATLQWLLHGNLFIFPLDDEDRWYRFHHLFATVLSAQLQQSDPQLPPLLHRRASEWFEQNDLIEEAVEHALRSGDMERVAVLLTRNRTRWFARSEFSTLQKFLNALPPSLLRTQPELCLSQAMLSLAAGQMERAGECIRAAEALHRVHPFDEPLATELAVARACYVNLIQPGREALAEGEAAFLRIPPERLNWRSALGNILALAYYQTGDMPAASRHGVEAVRVSEVMNSVVLRIATLSALGEVRIEQGLLRDADALLRQSVALGQPMGVPLPISRLGAAYLGLARIRYHWNRIEEAEEYLRLAHAFNRQIRNMDRVYLIHMTWARLCRLQGRVREAMEHVEMAASVTPRESIFEQVQVEAMRALLDLGEGRQEEAKRWIEQHALPTLSAARGRALPASLTYDTTIRYVAEVLIGLDRPLPALEMLAARLQVAEAEARFNSVIHLCVIQAMGLLASGEEEAARYAVERALALAEPEGYLTTFLEQGAPMARLLHRLHAGQAGTSHLDALLAAFRRPAGVEAPVRPKEGGTATPMPGLAEGLLDTLTPRELEVLRLIARGLTDREVAHQLSISARTVSTHLTRIYSKLNVTTRTAATRWAVEQGLT